MSFDQDQTQDDAHAEVGRNWEAVLQFARSLGYELDEVVFKNTLSENTVSMPFVQLQSARGISLLRIAMVAAKGIRRNDGESTD